LGVGRLLIVAVSADELPFSSAVECNLELHLGLLVEVENDGLFFLFSTDDIIAILLQLLTDRGVINDVDDAINATADNQNKSALIVFLLPRLSTVPMVPLGDVSSPSHFL